MLRRTQSFLTRLTRATPRPEVEDIAQNLENVLNTRKACSVLPNLGLGDYEAAPNTHEAVELLCAELEVVVGRCEPRLTEVRASLLGGRGYSTVRFELLGQVRGTRQLFGLDLDTTTRRFEVAIVEEPRR